MCAMATSFPKARRIVYTENPEDEMWRFLSRLTYSPHLNRLFNEKSLQATENEMVELSTFVSQANDYFRAARDTSMQISPVLLYYGTVNLFSAMRIIKRLNQTTIENHGMNLVYSENSKALSDIEVAVRPGKNSGLSNFINLFQEISDLGDIVNWPLGSILSYVPELHDDYSIGSISERRNMGLLPVEIIGEGDERRIFLDSETTGLINRTDLHNIIVDYTKNYLPPTQSSSNRILLRQKLDSEDTMIKSLSGRSYIRCFYLSNGKKGFLSSEIAYLMGLYMLGVVSRYRPSIWSPFVTRDASGERWLIERFLGIARRMIPNLIINAIEEREVVFSGNRPIA